jgi:hypothetical protein
MRILIILQFLVFISIAASAQNDNSSTLNKKWDNMLERAETYEHYKVIKRTDLNDIWKEIQDSVVFLKAKLLNDANHIKKQDQQITDLQQHVAEVNAKLEAVQEEKDNMSFIGLSVDKYSYAAILWVIIFLVLAVAGLALFLYFNSNRVTRQKIQDYDLLSKSFEEYKQGKIEMERKLKRELQTNLNLIEDLKSRRSKI